MPRPCPRAPRAHRPRAGRLGALWEVYLLSLLLGLVNMFDNPARQTFVIEMVGKDDLPNAVSLNSIVMNGGPGHRTGHRWRV